MKTKRTRKQCDVIEKRLRWEVVFSARKWAADPTEAKESRLRDAIAEHIEICEESETAE